MEPRHNVSILSSKKLTKSFTKNIDNNIWESLSLSREEAEKVIAIAIKKMTKNSDPLTITVTINA